jgi:effector-binding domain-containing protein
MTDVEIRTLQPMTTIAVRHETTTDGLSALFDRELPRVGAAMTAHGATMAGPPFARYHHYGDDRVDVEIGAPIEAMPPGLEPISGRTDGVIGVSSLPGGVAAVAVHAGPYDSLATTYDRLASWIASKGPPGRVAAAGPWEVYLTDPGRVPDPADWVTEVVWPLEPSP